MCVCVCVCVCVCGYVGMRVCAPGQKHVSRELKCADCVAMPTAVKDWLDFSIINIVLLLHTFIVVGLSLY